MIILKHANHIQSAFYSLKLLRQKKLQPKRELCRQLLLTKLNWYCSKRTRQILLGIARNLSAHSLLKQRDIAILRAIRITFPNQK